MQAGLHAIGWGLQRLAIGVGVTAFAIVFDYVIWITAIVVAQAMGGA